VKRLLAILASQRLTVSGLALLAAGVWLVNPGEGPIWLLTSALALLAVNLACAVAAYERLRRERGLLILHLCLLALILLVGLGRLMRLEGHVEMVDGQALADAPVQVVTRGPLHPDRLGRLDLRQGYYTVDYAPGMQRSDTRSRVWVDAEQREVGDDNPLVLRGYRFYTTHNKGFALLLDWTPTGGAARRGAVNLPRYPQFDWMQENRYTPPDGPEIGFRLQSPGPARQDVAWRLDSREAQGQLELRVGDRRWLLRPGQSVALPQGRLGYAGVRGWMGYQIYYDPTLPWLFLSAVLGAAGLAWHLMAPTLRRCRRDRKGQEAVTHAV